MMPPLYPRTIQATLERFLEIYPMIGLTGPRQSGKTTLAKFVFKNKPYVSLENLDTRFRASQDPRAFLATFPNGAILDEIQNLPELLSYLQEIADSSALKGRFILTGSQNFSLNQDLSQSLSGRIGMLTLLPLSLLELSNTHQTENGTQAESLSFLFKGGYPGLYQTSMRPTEFYPSYIQTYIERDVRQLKNIENLNRFQIFLKLCAGRIGQLLNLSSLAQDCGISHTTARQWLAILEASYLVFTLQPFHQNFSKRLVKMPKLYFYDTGLACSLLGLETEAQLQNHYLRGGLFENLALLEMIKKRINQGLPPHLYFWRDQTGHEVDLIAEWGGHLEAIEIKSGSTFQSEWVKSIEYFQKLSPSTRGYLISTSEQEGSYRGITLIPIKKASQI